MRSLEDPTRASPGLAIALSGTRLRISAATRRGGSSLPDPCLALRSPIRSTSCPFFCATLISLRCCRATVAWSARASMFTGLRPSPSSRSRVAALECPDLEAARDRMAARQAAVDDQSLPVDVARLVGCEEQGHVRYVDRLA